MYIYSNGCLYPPVRLTNIHSGVSIIYSEKQEDLNRRLEQIRVKLLELNADQQESAQNKKLVRIF